MPRCLPRINVCLLDRTRRRLLKFSSLHYFDFRRRCVVPKQSHDSAIRNDQLHSEGDGVLSARVDRERIARAVREILLAVGEDPDREGLRDTPIRVARMYAEMFSGLHKNPREHLKKRFTEKYDEIVLVKDIDFESLCEHH